jgi:hypothetical protein
MARVATVFEILLASPSDLPDERTSFRALVEEWNILHGRRRECVLEPVLWETHSTPEFGDRPQALLNRQVVDSCDALIGMFWTRLGTPTGQAASGTVEEIDRFVTQGKPVLLYFSAHPVEPDHVDVAQLTALREFKRACRTRSLVEEYESPEDLRRKLALGLERLVDTLVSRRKAETPAREVPAPRPDTRVVEMRKLLKRWQLAAELGPRGHDEGKALMRHFANWYVENHEALAEATAEWQSLGRLATQMTKYIFTQGRSSTKTFYQIGEAVLSNAIALLDTGEVALPLDGSTLAVLRCIQAAGRDDRKSADTVAQELGLPTDIVRNAVESLEKLGLIEPQMYINASVDYTTTGAGMVCIAVHPEESAA